ncbi:MAG: tetratricopeptide repeat protein [Candidatus Cloacimonetes bacterium]|nr:tetratricopeptide repeat protein [Candidatus Cloacimonadota bacterium]
MKKLIIITVVLLLLLSACSTSRQKLSPQGNVDYKTANVYYAQKDVEKAEVFYSKVLVDNPEHAIALRRMGDISLHNGELFVERSVEFNKKANEYYSQALAITEAYPELTDDEKLAIRDMKKRKESTWVRIFKSGETELKNGNTKAAMDIFELVHQLDKKRPEPMIQLKNIYLKELKNDTKAEEILLSLIKDDPDKLIYLQELGAFYYNKENYTEAVTYFENVRLQTPLDIDNIMNISACYYELKDYDKALKATQMAMELDPSNIDLLDNARSIAASMKDNELRITYLKQLLDKRDNENDYMAMVSIYLENEDYPQMIKYAEKWHNWDNTNKFAVQYLILAAQKTNNKSLESKYATIYKAMP